MKNKVMNYGIFVHQVKNKIMKRSINVYSILN